MEHILSILIFFPAVAALMAFIVEGRPPHGINTSA